jgi:hypothetical protein
MSLEAPPRRVARRASIPLFYVTALRTTPPGLMLALRRRPRPVVLGTHGRLAPRLELASPCPAVRNALWCAVQQVLPCDNGGKEGDWKPTEILTSCELLCRHQRDGHETRRPLSSQKSRSARVRSWPRTSNSERRTGYDGAHCSRQGRPDRMGRFFAPHQGKAGSHRRQQEPIDTAY